MPRSGEKKHAEQSGLKQATGTLVKALADKGGPGVVALGLIVVVPWFAGGELVSLLLWPIGSAHSSTSGATWSTGLPYVLLATLIFGGAIWLTRTVLSALPGTLRLDADTRETLAGAFGGRVSTVSGGFGLVALSKQQATARIKNILRALTDHAASQLAEAANRVGANLFISRDPAWLTMHESLHINMKVEGRGAEECKIRILNGFYSTGTSFWYGRPVLSIATKDKQWTHTPTAASLQSLGLPDQFLEISKAEIQKASPDLSWIISMPVPFQTSPHPLICGVLNLDSLSGKPHRDTLKMLLADLATAAALIGVINRTADVLGSNCRHVEMDKEASGVELLGADYLISPEEFNPNDCPEPSDAFRVRLSKISGLEFLKSLTSSDLAGFLREQLRY